jgi:tetratricopeptide (TPR) repeat protein
VGLGEFLRIQGELTRARSYLDEGLALAEALGGGSGIAVARQALGFLTTLEGDYPTARAHFATVLTRFEQVRHPRIALTLGWLGWIALLQEDPAAAALFAEALACCRERGIWGGMPMALIGLGVLAGQAGHPEQAQAWFLEAQALAEQSGDTTAGYVPQILAYQGWLALQQGEPAAARSLLAESLRRAREIPEIGGKRLAILQMGVVAARQAQAVPAARLLGAGAAMAAGYVLYPRYPRDYEPVLTALQADLGDAAFAAAWAEGQALSVEQAVAYALEEEA